MMNLQSILRNIAYATPWLWLTFWLLLAPEITLAQGVGTAGANAGLTGWQLTVYNMLTVIGAMFAWIGGFLLDVSIAVFVANMAGASSYMGLTSVVVALWEVIRDFINLLFIFSLIWIGFQTILGINGANTKKWVANLVIAALLINFSLYITQVVIDFSNVAALQISQLMQTETREDPIFGVEIGKISSGFVAKTNLQNFPAGSQEALKNLMGPDSGFDGFMAAMAFGFVVMLMLMVLGFVFAAGAIILFTRFIALTFLMAFSPLLFLGWILPDFDSYGKKWTKMLISQALVGPAFIFMLYFSYRALEGFTRMGTEGKEYTITNILIYFMVVTGFVILALVTARKIGDQGANQALSMLNNTGKWAQVKAANATFGVPAAFMRSTVGNLAQRGAESDKLLDRAARGGISGWAARRQLNALRTVGNSSMDVRKISGAGKSLGIGEGAKGGYKTMRDNYAKDRAKYADELGEVEDDDPVVDKYLRQVAVTEQLIANLKRDKKKVDGVGPEAEKTRKAIQQRITKAEADLKEQKAKIPVEKARRQIGSAEYNARKQDLDKKLAEGKAKMAAIYDNYQQKLENGSLTDAEKTVIFKELHDKKKEMAKINKELKQGGYANTLKNAAVLTSLFSGALPSFDKKAAKEIEKKYDKKFKQTDEDKRIASVVDAVKSSAPKDNH